MTMITPSYLGETIEYSSLHACRSTLEDPTDVRMHNCLVRIVAAQSENCQNFVNDPNSRASACQMASGMRANGLTQRLSDAHLT